MRGLLVPLAILEEDSRCTHIGKRPSFTHHGGFHLRQGLRMKKKSHVALRALSSIIDPSPRPKPLSPTLMPPLSIYTHSHPSPSSQIIHPMSPSIPPPNPAVPSHLYPPIPSHSSHPKPSNTPLHLHRNHLNIAPSLDPSLPSSLDNYNITTNRSTPSSLSRSESTSPANSQLIFLPEAHNSPLKNPPSETKSTERGCSY